MAGPTKGAALAPLNDRIADVLSASTTSVTVVDLLAETRQALADIQARYQREESKILDPLTRTDDAQAARDALERLLLDRRRLEAAVARLEERQEVVRQEEERQRNEAAVADAMKRHNEAVALLRDRYPKLAAELLDVLRTVAAADAEAERLNRSIGAGLPTVELTARGVTVDGRVPAVDMWKRSLTLLSAVRLPAFEATTDYLWPPAPRPG